jgi:hypothetical protein
MHSEPFPGSADISGVDCYLGFCGYSVVVDLVLDGRDVPDFTV